MLRYLGRTGGPRLGLVGKGVTFDSGGYFVKGQDDIVRQKADMGGAAAVVAATGAIAELGLPIDLITVVPAADNMTSGSAYRPSDIFTTAAGLTVEVTNPDAEGRLILADALWYARERGATHLVDVATLTGAMRSGMGDMYAGVFSNSDEWRARVVAAGEQSGDHAWPLAAPPALSRPARLASRRHQEHPPAELRLPDRRRDVSPRLRGRDDVGARRHSLDRGRRRAARLPPSGRDRGGGTDARRARERGELYLDLEVEICRNAVGGPVWPREGCLALVYLTFT